jgi:hypothetical protein
MVGSFADGAGEHGPYRWFNGTVDPVDEGRVTANDQDCNWNAQKLHVGIHG